METNNQQEAPIINQESADPAHEEEKPRKKLSSETKKIIISVASTFVATALITGLSVGYGIQGHQTRLENEAIEQCKESVLNKLKAPATASFPSIREDEFYSGKDVYGDPFVKIVSYVDAQNSFGANIRTEFSCRSVKTGDGEWQTTSSIDYDPNPFGMEE